MTADLLFDLLTDESHEHDPAFPRHHGVDVRKHQCELAMKLFSARSIAESPLAPTMLGDAARRLNTEGRRKVAEEGAAKIEKELDLWLRAYPSFNLLTERIDLDELRCWADGANDDELYQFEVAVDIRDLLNNDADGFDYDLHTWMPQGVSCDLSYALVGITGPRLKYSRRDDKKSDMPNLAVFRVTASNIELPDEAVEPSDD